MTIGVIFHAESNIKSIWGDIIPWTNALEKLGVDFYIAVDEEGINSNWVETKDIEGHRVSTEPEALTKLAEIHPECKTVLFDLEATLELKDLNRLTDICYIVGRDSGNTFAVRPDHKVKLYSPNLWAIQCISIALYERFANGGL